LFTPLADAELHQRNGYPITREAVDRARSLLLAQPDNLEFTLTAVSALIGNLNAQPAGSPTLAPQ